MPIKMTIMMSDRAAQKQKALEMGCPYCCPCCCCANKELSLSAKGSPCATCADFERGV